MIKNPRHIRVFKGVTFAMLAFYGVATGRSLVPGLCTTLAAISGSEEIQVADSCCALPESNGTAISTPSKTFALCALCNLTESVSNPVVYVYELPAHVAPHSFDSLRVTDPALPHVWSPAALRAPPGIA